MGITALIFTKSACTTQYQQPYITGLSGTNYHFSINCTEYHNIFILHTLSVYYKSKLYTVLMYVLIYFVTEKAMLF